VWGFRATLYEGEGGALRGALLPITVFLAVKATGGAGLALWERALVPSAFITKISASLSRRLVKASTTFLTSSRDP
jgi:hypothetical protein